MDGLLKHAIPLEKRGGFDRDELDTMVLLVKRPTVQ